MTTECSRFKLLFQRHAWRLVVPGTLVVLLIGLGLAVKPAYRVFREHRIHANLEAARAAARNGDWSLARDQARSVLLARQNDFEAYRIWARALGKLGAPSTYMAAAELFTNARSTREDLLEALQVMTHQAPQAVALSAYASLPPQFLDQAAFRAAMVPLLIQRGQIDLAEKCLRDVAQPTDPPPVRLELLRTLCSRPQAARVAEARQIFADLIAARADEESLAALLILGDTPGGLAAGDPLPDLPAWLKGQTLANARHHLLGIDPALAAQPEAAARLYDAASQRFLAGDPGALGQWLIRHDQAALAVRILKEPALTRGDAYLARLKALLHLNLNDDLTAALAAPPASADLVELEIVQANAATRSGDLIAAGAAWTRALNLAAYDTSRNRCLEIARLADQSGAKDSAEDAWVASVRLGWGPLPLYDDLRPVFASLVAKGRSEDLTAMFRTLLRFEPNNPELLNNACYFGLIHGLLPPQQVATLLTRLIARSDKPAYQSTLMLAEMLDGRPADALTRLPKFRGSPGVPPMMGAALEGTAKVLTGDTEAGTAVLKEVDWRGFMTQERIVFRNLLVKFTHSKLPLPELASPAVALAPDQIPAWRKAVERSEKDRAGDVLPALVATKIPGTDPLVPTRDVDQSPAWRKALERHGEDELLPALPPPPLPGTNPPAESHESH